jgi:hypothetical protein
MIILGRGLSRGSGVFLSRAHVAEEGISSEE